jgi:hypothetical protein
MKKTQNNKEINLNDYPVGTGVTHRIGTDCYPYEVVENISSKKIKVRKLKEVPTKNSNYYSNQDYTYKSTNAKPIELILGKHKGYPCIKKVYYTVEYVENFDEIIIEKYGSLKNYWDSDDFETLMDNKDEGISTDGLTYIKRNTSLQSFHFGNARYYQDPCF